MPYKDGSWGEKAKKRATKRAGYFSKYNKQRDLLKVNARYQVYKAIKQGELVIKCCERKSKECRGRIEADHSDYKKPLEVTWLCSFHHRQVENERKPDSTCLCCGVIIKAPKIKYCTSRCNLKHWRYTQA